MQNKNIERIMKCSNWKPSLFVWKLFILLIFTKDVQNPSDSSKYSDSPHEICRNVFSMVDVILQLTA